MIAPKQARPTIRFIDEYCDLYQPLFSDVRAFEAFKHLHVGMLSDIKRKSLETGLNMALNTAKMSWDGRIFESPIMAR
ncbi:MAG: hypothetical protein F6K65_41220 [Moorea sp. SIO3C2]|nr:hypothetical protein [Moorena sp. SIO3C2]